MFRINQILTATQFVRSFREVGAFLSRNPEPLLMTQKMGGLSWSWTANFLKA